MKQARAFKPRTNLPPIRAHMHAYEFMGGLNSRRVQTV